MKALHIVAWILLIVGGLNWLLVGLGMYMNADWNVVHMIFGSVPMLEALIYVLVGLAAIYELVMHRGMCKACAGTGSSMM